MPSGLTMREAHGRSSGSTPITSARRRGARRELHAYVELHIEQGPVLEQQNLPVGVVTAISGATRLAANLTGMAGHAGTVPMALRRDALAGAAECIVAVEEFCKTDERRAGRHRRRHHGAAGRHQRHPGRGIVHARHSRAGGYASQARGRRYRPPDRGDREAPRLGAADRRHPREPHRALRAWLKAQMAEAVAAEGYGVFELPSGAGHDGMAMIDIADVAMLFVRCRGGISHHPAEHVEPADADAGARVLLRLIENFRPRGSAAVPASIYDRPVTSAMSSDRETNQIDVRNTNAWYAVTRQQPR